MMHLNRKEIADVCPTCSAPEYIPCIQDENEVPTPTAQLELNLSNAPGEVEYLEYQVFSAISRLRELQPNHTLVTVMQAVLKYRVKSQAE